MNLLTLRGRIQSMDETSFTPPDVISAEGKKTLPIEHPKTASEKIVSESKWNDEKLAKFAAELNKILYLAQTMGEKFSPSSEDEAVIRQAIDYIDQETRKAILDDNVMRKQTLEDFSKVISVVDFNMHPEKRRQAVQVEAEKTRLKKEEETRETNTALEAEQKRLLGIKEKELEIQKHVLQDVVSEIEKIDEKDFETKTLDDFSELKKRLYEIRDILQGKGVAFIDVDSRYDKQEVRLLGFIERAKIKEMSFSEIVEIIIAKNYDPFKTAAEQGNITDPYEREIIKRFQVIYYTATDSIVVYEKDPITKEDVIVRNANTGKDEKVENKLLTAEKQREHHRVKTKIWAYRYQDEHYGGQYIPAANPDQLYAKMKSRKLFRDDILAGVMDEKAYGTGPREMFEYAIKIVADEIDLFEYDEDGKLKLDSNGYPIRPYSYDTLKKEPDAPTKLKAHLKDLFVGTDKNKVSEKDFEILWNLYLCFDLASISLAILQKGTKTRGHNQGTSADNQAFRTYPLEVMSHKRNRYGNLDVAQQHLLAFTGEYPKDKRNTHKNNTDTWEYVWAGNKSRVEGTEVRTVDETQELVKLYMEAFFPLKGIENSILPNTSGDVKWSKPVFPDHLQFLIEPTGKIGSQDLYEIAAKGWDQLLDMTVGELGSSITLEKIFNTNDGLYTRFINSGMGLAKVVTGEHLTWFPTLLRYFVGRLAAGFEGSDITSRRELRDRLVEQLKISTAPGGGLDLSGNNGKEIRGFITELEEGKNASLLDKAKYQWAEIPEILRPWQHHMRRSKRIAYMKAWYEDKTHRAAPRADIDIRRINLTGDPDLKTFYDAIDERAPLPKIIDRSAKSTDTAEKK